MPLAKVLYLWGLSNGPGGTKAGRLRGAHHIVLEPERLPYPTSYLAAPLAILTHRFWFPQGGVVGQPRRTT